MTAYELARLEYRSRELLKACQRSEVRHAPRQSHRPSEAFRPMVTRVSPAMVPNWFQLVTDGLAIPIQEQYLPYQNTQRRKSLVRRRRMAERLRLGLVAGLLAVLVLGACCGSCIYHWSK